MRLYLIRHGETDYNRERRMQGHGPVPLNAAGIAQATRLAGRLADEGAIDHIYSSDLLRTRMTAEILAGHTGRDVTYHELFRERDPGDLTDRSYEEGLAFFTDPDFDPPGGESVSVFADRVRRAADHLIELEGTRGRTVALVTHGMFCSAFLEGVLRRARTGGFSWPNTALTISAYDPAGRAWTLETLACAAHLDDFDPTAHATGG